MRVGQQVVEAAGSADEAVRLLELVGVPDARRRLASFPHELSGGLRQRVMIAMAVAGNPDLVIADEPTTALDVTVQAQVLRLLGTLRDELGCSVLMITHDLGVAAQVADRVAVMYAGRLAEVGPTTTVLNESAHPYTVGLMRSRLSLVTDRASALTTVPGSSPDPASMPAGCAYAPRCAIATEMCRDALPEPVPAGGDEAHLRACIADMSKVREIALAADVPVAAVALDPTRTHAASVRRVEKTFRIKVSRTFGPRARLAALRRISLDIAEGESVALVGESGSGKSTLLRIIAGLERPDDGEVSLGSGARPQMVFQDAGASLTPWMTVGALIGERLRHEKISRSARRERVIASLAKVGLAETVAGVRAAELSGGQRQRVALARATVVPPEVLLCDEPTSALDVSLAASVLNLIRELRSELGMAVLFVTHDLSVARIVADRIAVMYLGKIVEVGAAEQLIASPQHPYTQALIGAVPDFGGQLPVVRGEPASPLAPPPGCEFHPRCPKAVEACALPELDVPLELLPHGSVGVDRDVHRVACIRAGSS
jgi:peptide/nickel transport system ATP-binding protein